MHTHSHVHEIDQCPSSCRFKAASLPGWSGVFFLGAFFKHRMSWTVNWEKQQKHIKKRCFLLTSRSRASDGSGSPRNQSGTTNFTMGLGTHDRHVPGRGKLWKHSWGILFWPVEEAQLELYPCFWRTLTLGGATILGDPTRWRKKRGEVPLIIHWSGICTETTSQRLKEIYVVRLRTMLYKQHAKFCFEFGFWKIISGACCILLDGRLLQHDPWWFQSVPVPFCKDVASCILHGKGLKTSLLLWVLGDNPKGDKRTIPHEEKCQDARPFRWGATGVWMGFSFRAANRASEFRLSDSVFLSRKAFRNVDWETAGI